MRSPRIYELVFRHLIRYVPAELAHKLGLRALRALALVPGALSLTARLLRPPTSLRVDALGLHFRSPLGVAAGVDKDATVFDSLAVLGFGSVEVGTATAEAQPGNPGRRVWRLPDDRALLNKMGFPNHGAAAAARRLSLPRRTDAVIGVNVGKTKTVPIEDAAADYRAATTKLAPYADYVTINVSSPNTPGLRGMQTAEQLESLVAAVRAALAEAGRPLPVLVKLGPDLADEEIRALAAAAARIGADGIIAVNTTTVYDEIEISRAKVREYGDAGGVSGAPLRSRALAVLSLLHESVGDLPLISVGGIEDAEDVWNRILAGATLVQAYTGFVYGGPLWPHRLNRHLARLLADSPYDTLAEAVGKGADEAQRGAPRLGNAARVPSSGSGLASA